MTQQTADVGVEGLRAALAEADPLDAAWLAKLAESDPLPGGERNGIAAGDWEADDLGLPPDCPVIPLGVDDGVYWFLDTLGQLRALEFGQFGQKAINSLFMGRHHYLYWAWPRANKDGAIVSWRQEKAAEDLMGACAHKGPWNAIERARGRGAWLLATGKLALHCGTQLFQDGKRTSLGELEGNVYMTRPPILHPWSKAITSANGPGTYLYPLLCTWNWSRPVIDPMLFIGWLGAAFVGGALLFRPAIYMTGDTATGKSTLQQLMKMIFGNALIKSGDTTAAGIYQLLKSDALPVAVDELEGKADTRRTKAIIELARLAASGDLMLRGGEAHKGTQFNARSCFAFSSINTPPLEPQDLNRMGLLQLNELPAGSISPNLDERKLHNMGRMILRRMMDGWEKFPEINLRYREALAKAGHKGRGQDAIGTLLTCADIVMGADAAELRVPILSLDPTSEFWTKNLNIKNMVEYENSEKNWRLALNHLLSTQIDAWKGGGQQTMGEVLEKLFAGRMDFDEARALAQKTGLTIHKATTGHQKTSLFIPNNNPLLFKLFQGSKWQGDLGAGVWSGALRQAPQASFRLASGRVNGVKSKGTLFDLAVVLNREDEAEKVKERDNDQQSF